MDDEAQKAADRERQALHVMSLLPGPPDPESGRWRLIMKGLKSMSPEALDTMEAMLMVSAVKIAPEGAQPPAESGGMSDETYEAYLECKRAFEEKVLALVPAYFSATAYRRSLTCDLTDLRHLTDVTGVDEEHVRIEGYGGRMDHKIYIPRKFLTDPEYRAKMLRGEPVE